MKITLNNINYKGVYIRLYECELPPFMNMFDTPDDEVVEFIIKSLDAYLKTKNGR